MMRGASLALLVLSLGSCTAGGDGPARPAPVEAPPAAPAPPAAAAAREPVITLEGDQEQGGFARGIAPAGTVSLKLGAEPVEVAPDGRFIIGFGRDAAPEAMLEAMLADGTTVRRALAIAPRQWDIQSLPTLPKGTTPTPEFVKRRSAELAQIDAARALRTGAFGWRQQFAWPAVGRISGVFGSQRIYAGEPGQYHSGVDIARPAGAPVLAPADGVVVLAAPAPFTLEGNLLMIDHGMGLNSAFLHLSRIDVSVGDRVVRGQQIGLVGMTGRATGPHLHWAVKWHAERLDPALLAGPMPEIRQP